MSGIYELTCNTGKLSYIGKTSHSLKQRYQEHVRHIKVRHSNQYPDAIPT
jgi:hypothetical protein